MSNINIGIYAKDHATAVFSKINNSATSAFSSMSVTVGNLAANAIQSAVSGFQTLVMDAINLGGELSDTSAKLGINTEQLQILKYMAKMTGTEFGALTGSIGKMMGNLATGSLDDLLTNLGINLQDLEGMQPDEIFRKIGGAIANIKDPSVKIAAAKKIFGKTGADLIPMLGNSGADFEANYNKATKDAPKMSASTVVALDAIGDAMDKAKMSMIVIAGETIPYLVAIYQGVLVPAMDWVCKKFELIRAWLDNNADGVKMAIDIYLWFQNTILTVFQIIYATIKFVLGSAIDIVKITLSNMVSAGFWLYDNWSKIWGNLPNVVFAALQSIGTGIKALWEQLKNGTFNPAALFDGMQAEFNRQTKEIGLTKLELDNPYAALGENAKQYAADIMDINTTVFSDAANRTKQAFLDEKAKNEAAAKNKLKIHAAADGDILKKTKALSSDLADALSNGTEAAAKALSEAFLIASGRNKTKDATSGNNGGIDLNGDGESDTGLNIPTATASASPSHTEANGGAGSVDTKTIILVSIRDYLASMDAKLNNLGLA